MASRTPCSLFLRAEMSFTDQKGGTSTAIRARHVGLVPQPVKVLDDEEPLVLERTHVSVRHDGPAPGIQNGDVLKRQTRPRASQVKASSSYSKVLTAMMSVSPGTRWK